jgi:hypothetical protein
MSHWCRWEYRTLTFAHADGRHNVAPGIDEFSTELNRLGLEGWEAFFVGAGVVQLKRQHPVMPAAQRPPARPMSPLELGTKDPAE